MNKSVKQVPNTHLLKNRKVIEEINRHLWIESEKAGYDIGFNQAAEDWLLRFSKAWMHYHTPKRNITSKTKTRLKKAVTKRHAAARKKASRR